MKATFLFIVFISLAGCANKYPNWEYVRIEFEVPSTDCQYKVQEACSRAGAACYKFYKQRATVFGANTVVITNASKDVVASSTAVVYQGSGGASSSVRTDITSLADYYYCPTK